MTVSLRVLDGIVESATGIVPTDDNRWYDSSSFGKPVMFNGKRFRRYSVRAEDQDSALIYQHQIQQLIAHSSVRDWGIIVQSWNQTTMWCHICRDWVKCSKWKVQLLIPYNK